MNYQIFYRCFVLFLCLFICGCKSISRTPHSCKIYLESESINEYSLVKTLPVSGLSINVMSVPVLDEQDIKHASIVQKEFGSILNLYLTDHAAYEMYNLLFEANDRRLILEYDGIVIGFSIVSTIFHSELAFIPEVSNVFCKKICENLNSFKK